jgi:hypothetical protein
VNCSAAPPPRPGAGTVAWSGSYAYGTNVSYTCGPYGRFQGPGNTQYETVTATCAWNMSWVPEVVPNCVATSCPQIPFPPSSTGLVFKPDARNNMTLRSGELTAMSTTI